MADEQTPFLPCPFCGSTDLMLQPQSTPGQDWVRVYCRKCCCASRSEKTGMEAINTWNERAEPTFEFAEGVVIAAGKQGYEKAIEDIRTAAGPYSTMAPKEKQSFDAGLARGWDPAKAQAVADEAHTRGYMNAVADGDKMQAQTAQILNDLTQRVRDLKALDAILYETTEAAFREGFNEALDEGAMVTDYAEAWEGSDARKAVSPQADQIEDDAATFGVDAADAAARVAEGHGVKLSGEDAAAVADAVADPPKPSAKLCDAMNLDPTAATLQDMIVAEGHRKQRQGLVCSTVMGENPEPCCKYDHDKDGDCHIHREGKQPDKVELIAREVCKARGLDPGAIVFGRRCTNQEAVADWATRIVEVLQAAVVVETAHNKVARASSRDRNVPRGGPVMDAADVSDYEEPTK